MFEDNRKTPVSRNGKIIEYSCRRLLFRFLFFLQFTTSLILPQPNSASGFSPVEHKSFGGFEKIYSQTAQGLGFQIIGESLLVERRIKKAGRVQLSVSSPVKKAFLIWSGEVKEQNKNAGEIHFLGPQNQEHRIAAQRLWQKNSTGILYSALADVTRHVTGSGLYGVKNLSSEVVNPGGEDPYSVAGWALVVVTKDRNSEQTHSVTFLAGLRVLRPGEIYDFPLTPYLPMGFAQPGSIGIVGGHGRAGNGSGNLLNGLAISGKDDWDGSAGKFWDIDLFEPYPHTNYIAENEDLTLTIDPLLQWLYPIGVILQSWSADY